jgi:hypothetical protein
MDRFKPSFFAFLTRDLKNSLLFWVLTIAIIASAIYSFIDVNWEGPVFVLAIAGIAQAINVYKDYQKYKQIYR